MRVHDTPGAETDYPQERKIIWGHDYGTHGDGDLERPFIEDAPPEGHGWDTRSRWGSRPAREFDGPYTVRGAWSRVPRIFRVGQDPMGKDGASA
jgi:hypothetical protein